VGGWATPVDPALFVYTPGSITQFSDLATSMLAGVGDQTDTWETDWLSYLLGLPAVGTGIPGADDTVLALESAITDFGTDEFGPILTDVLNVGGGIDAVATGLSLLDAFGAVALSGILPNIFFNLIQQIWGGIYTLVNQMENELMQWIYDILATWSGIF
jgi:hypothetical protein